jgi:hypothetical protein
MHDRHVSKTIIRGCAAVLLLAALVHPGLPCRADIVDVVATRDNTLYEDATGAFSNGAGAYMFSGVNASEAERRALVYFDLAQSVPRGSVVTSATLTLHCSRSVAASGEFAVHRVTADWGEGTSNAGDPGGQGAASQPGDATWQHRFYPDIPWSNPGGDFAATPSASRDVGTFGPFAWTGTGLVNDVQAWIDAPATNFGWIILNATGSPRNARRWDTRESADPNVRPMLRVVFTPPSRCVADVDDGTGTGTPDGGVTIDDLLYYLVLFEAGDSDADVDDGTATGTPDGGVTIDDLLYFLQRFADGC